MRGGLEELLPTSEPAGYGGRFREGIEDEADGNRGASRSEVSGEWRPLHQSVRRTSAETSFGQGYFRIGGNVTNPYHAEDAD